MCANFCSYCKKRNLFTLRTTNIKVLPVLKILIFAEVTAKRGSFSEYSEFKNVIEICTA